YIFFLHCAVWTLTYEIAFHMLFMCALMCSQRYRKLIASASIVGLFLGLQYMVHDEIGFSAYQKADASVNKLVQPLVAIFSSPMVIEFALGIVLYVVC